MATSRWIDQNILMFAVPFIFTYTIGFMQSPPIKFELYAIWPVSFFAVLGCTNSITAYELDDNKQWMIGGGGIQEQQ